MGTSFNFVITVTFLLAVSAGAACVDFTGDYSPTSARLKIRQTGCETVTITGHEPGTGWGISTGLNQLVDGQFYEYIYDESGMGNYHELVQPKSDQLAKIRVKLTFGEETLVYAMQTRSTDFGKPGEWERVKETTFSFQEGKLKSVARGKNWSDEDYETNHLSLRDEIYMSCSAGKNSTYEKLALGRDSEGFYLKNVLKNSYKSNEQRVQSIEDMGLSKGYVLSTPDQLKQTFSADIEIAQGVMISDKGDGKTEVENFLCAKKDSVDF